MLVAVLVPKRYTEDEKIVGQFNVFAYFSLFDVIAMFTDLPTS